MRESRGLVGRRGLGVLIWAAAHDRILHQSPNSTRKADETRLALLTCLSPARENKGGRSARRSGLNHLCHCCLELPWQRPAGSRAFALFARPYLSPPNRIPSAPLPLYPQPQPPSRPRRSRWLAQRSGVLLETSEGQNNYSPCSLSCVLHPHLSPLPRPSS